MSKPAPPKQEKAGQKEPQQFPTCKNKKEAKLVCLNPACQEHAFFCTGCENDECEVIHHHGNKLLSVSFNEYVKKVLKERKLDEPLEQAIRGYTECLEKLKKDVLQFVEKELKELEEIRRKATELGDDEERLIKKLRNKEYIDLKGAELDNLWQKTAEAQGKNKNKDTIQFLTIKKEEVMQISDNFEKVNKMEMEDFMEDDNQNDQSKEKPTAKDKDGAGSKQSKSAQDPGPAKKEEVAGNSSAKAVKKK